MSKPPPKPVKPGKGGARRVPWPPRCPALPLPLGRADRARTRPAASLSGADPPGRVALLRSLHGGIVGDSKRISRIF